MKPLFKENSIKLLTLIFFICAYSSVNQVYAQCSSAVALTVPDNYLGSGFVGNGNFNAIIFGNINALSGDTEGRLAVAGDFKSVDGYSVGYGSIGPSAPDNDDNFIVNGTYNGATNFGVIGNFIYNNVSAGSMYPTHPAGQGSNSGPITDRLAFNTLKTAYTDLSVGLATLTANGSVVYNDYGSYVDIILTGTDAATNVFNLTIPDKMYGFIFNSIPPASQILFNVTNKVVNIDGGSMPSTYRARMLFNFPQAVSITFAHYAFQASVLAPLADFSGSGGSINGQAVIGGNVEQLNGFEFHNICSSFVTPTGTPLPVTLTSFSVEKEGRQSIVNWKTTEESNSERFEIQHSMDARSWDLVGTVAAKGESNSLISYQFIHADPSNGKNYYRLKMIDGDATFAYSRIADISMKMPVSFAVYPNPVVSQVTIETADWNKVKEVFLISASGKRTSMSATSDKIDMSNVSAGIYIIQLNKINGSVSTAKIIKQ